MKLTLLKRVNTFSSTLLRAASAFYCVKCGLTSTEELNTFLTVLPACRLSYIGVNVIGTTSTEEKAKLAKANGAEHVIIYSKDTLPEVVKKIKALTPDGEGVHAVLDGVGADTWESDFEVARRKATLVTFGNASGPVPPFAPLKLGAKNLKGA